MPKIESMEYIYIYINGIYMVKIGLAKNVLKTKNEKNEKNNI